MPWEARSVLAQLRLGRYRVLNSYLARFNPVIADVCNRCITSPHTTRHLFDCPARPTDLTPLSLWTDSVKVTKVLELDPNNNIPFLTLIPSTVFVFV